MKNELIFSIKKHTDALIKQTKTKPHETLELKMNKQMQTFSFNPPLNLLGEGKCLLGITSLECTNSLYNITNESNSFSFLIPGHYHTEFAEKIDNDLNKLLEFKSLELHVKEVRNRGSKIKIGVRNINYQFLKLKKMRYLKN